MCLILNKSYLAPKADFEASIQLRFLLLNHPYTVILNNYKSNFLDLSKLRDLIRLNNGFAYHPNKDVKTRAFKEFSTVLSSNVLNGLVVFAFFNNHRDLNNFLNADGLLNIATKLSYFSLLSYGHLVQKSFINNFFSNYSNISFNTLFFCETVSTCNKIFFLSSSKIFNHSLTKIIKILNAYVKSIN